MHYLIIKKDRTRTLSCKHKKITLSGFFANKVNSLLFFTSFRYNLMCYFLKSNKIYLNRVMLYKIIVEELGSSFGLMN